MERFEGEGGIRESSNPQDLELFGANPAGNEVFDASQYAFFGNDVVEEVELGGLEDEDDVIPPAGFGDEEYQLDRDEVDVLGSFGEIDELAGTFSKLNKVVSGPRNAGYIGDKGSRESSSAGDWVQERDFPNWGEQHPFDIESSQESKRWSSQPYPQSAYYMDSKNLHRTSSYPDQPQQYPQQQQNLHHHYSSEPILIPKSSFTSYPPPGGRSHQGSPNDQTRPPNIPYQAGGHQMARSSSNLSPFASPQLPMTALPPHGSPLGGNMPQFSPSGLPVNSRMQNQWLNQPNMYPGDHPNLPNNLLQQHLPPQNGILPPQMMSQQHRLQSPFPPSFGHVPGLQPPLYSQHISSSPQMINNFDVLGLADLRDPRIKTMVKGRLGMRYSQGFDVGGQRTGNGWPQFKSKYMTADEIENILRMQLAATHSNDPYVDDYYHQACLAKKTAAAKLKHHFCPNGLKDGAPRARANNEPHHFLQLDALGRVSFSSIRRPRPLLEVESPSSAGTGVSEQKVCEKPLEQEPMLAARVTIEDGILLLLDVDDIDRFLLFNQLEDGGAQLKQRRQMLLEGLAASLQLVDPLGKNGDTMDRTPKDDLVFLRIVSLSKGRKLLSKYLQHLSPGDELIRVVCMAIFRRLRFLFGGPPADPGASEVTDNLAKIVAISVQGMELKALAACLASVVCSTEHPPLRPIGSPAGDGSSLILKSVLDRATDLLRDPHASGNCSMPNRAFWQASFDAFFSLLTKYCFNKYDTIMQSYITQTPTDMSTNGSDAARAISKEMPVELLRASLPHTSEQQRKLLLDFAQRSMPVQGFSSQGGVSGSS